MRDYWTAVSSIDGWLTRGEARTLGALAFHCVRPIIEIGSWQGRSTVCMALASTVPIYAIDPHDGYTGDPKWKGKTYRGVTETLPLLLANLERIGVSERVTVLVANSEQALLSLKVKEVDLLYIDSEHTYEAAKQDILLYWPKLAVGGYLAMHDMDEHTRYEDLRALRTELLAEKAFQEARTTESLLYGRKGYRSKNFLGS